MQSTLLICGSDVRELVAARSPDGATVDTAALSNEIRRVISETIRQMADAGADRIIVATGARAA
jgi:hypothetical protein